MIIQARIPQASPLMRQPASALASPPSTYSVTTANTPPTPDSRTPASTTPGTESERLLKELRDYIDKGPIVALREKMLKSMNLTEDKIKAMSPEQQSAVEDEISRKIKDFLLAQQETAQGRTSPQQAQAKLIAYQAMHATQK